jgi:hypothetical protein
VPFEDTGGNAVNHRTLLCAGLALTLSFATASGAEVKKAVGSIELTDPAGDVKPISTNEGPVPGFDVVKLSISSDGKLIKIGATLKDPPGDFASDVVELYVDTDNNPKTGAGLFSYKELTGFEYKGKLSACADYVDGASACSGGMGSKVKLHFGAINLERYKGADESAAETIVDDMGFSGSKASSKLPIEAKLVQASLDYADLKVKPGQTIRVLVRESCSPRNPSSFFPEIHLTLK